jgi:hypothetical protein
MRPKKQILLVGSDEDRLGVLSYLLEMHSYTVARATSAWAEFDRTRPGGD